MEMPFSHICVKTLVRCIFCLDWSECSKTWFHNCRVNTLVTTIISLSSHKSSPGEDTGPSANKVHFNSFLKGQSSKSVFYTTNFFLGSLLCGFCAFSPQSCGFPLGASVSFCFTKACILSL